MMKAKMGVIALALLLSAPIICIAVADDSDAAYEYVAVSESQTWYRTVEKIHYNSFSPSSRNELLSTDDRDSEFQKFVDGEKLIDELTGFVTSVPWSAGGDDYYVYWMKPEYSSETTYQGYESTPFVPTKGTDLLVMDPGMYTIKVTGVRVGTNSIESDVTAYSLDGDRIKEFEINEEETVYFVSPTTLYFKNPDNSRACSPTVSFTSSKEISTPEKGTGENSIKLSLGYCWVANDYYLSAGDYRFNGQISYIFEPNSDAERSFLNDIVLNNVSDVPSAYDAYRADIGTIALSGGNYTMYRIGWENSDAEDCTLYYERNSASGNANSQRCTVYDNYDRSFRFFVPANSSFSVCVEYDMSAFVVIMERNGYDEEIALASGYVYNFEYGQANEYSISVDTRHYSNNPPLYAELKYSVTGESDSDSAAPAFAVLAVVLCVIPFALLGLSGLRPKWSK